MSVAYLDTHVVLWLHHGQLKKLTKEARREIERSSLLISPMAYLELSYLSQRQRSDAAPADILGARPNIAREADRPVRPPVARFFV